MTNTKTTEIIYLQISDVLATTDAYFKLNCNDSLQRVFSSKKATVVVKTSLIY